jgi:chromate transporter
MSALAALAALFGQLSLLAVGGVMSVVPEMQRQVVEVRHWMTAEQFAALYALAQAAPGPNMMVSTLVGLRVAGLPGALVATISLTGPSSTLAFIVSRVWDRFRGAPWRRVVQAGLTPVTVGLVLASSMLLAETTSSDWQTALVTLAAAAGMLLTRLNPLWILGSAAALGALGLL